MTSPKKGRNSSSTETQLTNCFLTEPWRKVGVSGYLLLITLLYAEGVFIERPKNAIVVVNHSTFFNCSKSGSKSNEPTWYHHTFFRARQDVYDNQKIKDKYKDRFSIDKNVTSGTFNLLVQRPEPSDAGTYECVEDTLVEDTGPSAELTVLHSNLVCESNKDLNEIVGHTECAKPISPDQLQLICSVTYSGNIPPKMEWRKVGNELLSNKTECGERDNRVMCNATVESDRKMAGSVFICQIKTAEQYSCSLKDNNFIYAFSDTSIRAIAATEYAVCSANTSVDLLCTYKWNKDNRTVQFGQTLKPDNSGIYSCEAECKIRNEICAFTAMVINVSNSDTGNLKIMWILLFIIIITLGVIATSAYCIRKKYSGGAKPTQPPPVTVSIRLAELQEPFLSPQDGSSESIRKIVDQAPYQSRGLSGGDIHGPMQYKEKQCSCERIRCTYDEQIQTNNMETLSKCHLWTALDHNNLIKFYDVLVISQDLFVMMEYAAGGSVRNAMKKCADSKINPGMQVIKDWATQIAQGMEYLHKRGIVHKNLDSVRILIMEPFEASNITKKTLKISQFCFIDGNFTSSHAQEKFSFTAPEVFDGTYDEQGDVWSFGIVMWEMLTGRIPYKDEKALTKITQDIRNGATVLKIPDSCPIALDEILNGCRRLDASERPSFSEIVGRLRAWQPVNSPA